MALLLNSQHARCSPAPGNSWLHLLIHCKLVQGDDAEWYDENVPSSEGFRPRGENDVVEGHISIEVQHLMTCYECHHLMLPLMSKFALIYASDTRTSRHRPAQSLEKRPCCWTQATFEMDAAGTVTTRWRVDATEALPAPLADPGLMKCASDVAWACVQASCP